MVGGTRKHVSQEGGRKFESPEGRRAFACTLASSDTPFMKWVKSCCYISHVSYQNCFQGMLPVRTYHSSHAFLCGGGSREIWKVCILNLF